MRLPTKFDHRVFVRIHHGYDEHPKVMPLSDAAFRAHIGAICWASRNEGRYRIPKTVAGKKWRPKVIRELLDAVLFEDRGDTYEVHDYLDFNRSAEEIAAYREARGEAGSVGNHMRWHVARRKVDKDCEHCREGS